MCGGYPKSESGNPNWILWLRNGINDEQRQMLLVKSIETMAEFEGVSLVVATTEETAQWLRSQDWVARLDKDTSQDWMESLDK